MARNRRHVQTVTTHGAPLSHIIATLVVYGDSHDGQWADRVVKEYRAQVSQETWRAWRKDFERWARRKDPRGEYHQWGRYDSIN